MNERQKEVLKSQLKDEERVLKDLRQVYKKASNDILDKIKALEARTDSENLQSIIYQKQYQQALKSQIDAILDNLNGGQFQTISEYLTKSYENGFFGTMYDLHGQGIPLIVPIDQKQVVEAVQIDSKISEGLYKRLGVDTKVLKSSIRANVSRGIASAMPWAQVARNINNRMGIGERNAYRIARTESHRIANEATYNAQTKAKESGADVVKQWDATLDKVTRPHHQQLDGQIREIDEPFEIDGRSAMFPGGFGVAAEDINCRCASLQRARWALTEEELQTLKERAEYFGLDKTDSFDDFKQKYLNAVEAEEVTSETYSPAKTMEEAENFIANYVDDSQFGALGVSYSGLSLDVANEINETFYKFYEDFDFQKFGGITAPAGNTKLGKQIDGAFAGYSSARNSFIVNRKTLKNTATAHAHFEQEKTNLAKMMQHPERYDFSKLNKTARQVIEASMKAGRTIVPETIEEAINHELGHMVEKRLRKTDSWQIVLNGMPTYSVKLSGYATTEAGEYVAESFASWRKGETLADPDLIKVFKGLMRNGRN